MDHRSCNGANGPFKGDGEDAEDEVECLECRYGFDGAVKILGEEVEKDLRPEVAFEGGSDLIWRGMLVSARAW